MTPEVGQVNQNIAANRWSAAPAAVAIGIDASSAPPQVQTAAAEPHAVETWELDLAEKAGASLSVTLPHKTSAELAEDLLELLALEQEARRSQNLNHWREYAPGYLDKLVRSIANKEAWRRRKIDAFYKSDYPRALAIAEKALRSKEEAQDAVGEAFVRLITDGTRIEWFYRTLRHILVDRLRERGAEGQLFVSLDALIADSARGDGESDGEDGLPGQLPSRSADCLDPMLVLMDRRIRRSKPLMVGQAKIHKKMRSARRGKWTDKLENPRTEPAPQTNR